MLAETRRHEFVLRTGARPTQDGSAICLMHDQLHITTVSGGVSGVEFAPLVRQASSGDPLFATDFVSTVLRSARDAGARDVHIEPTAGELAVRWRLDGVLHDLVRLPRDVAANVIARLKVLSNLLTYESALPQEGRIWDDQLRVEVRVSTFPSLYGERAVLRLL